jgi:hypothetical protein
MIHRFIRFTFLAICSFLLLACSRPSVEDIEPHIKSHFQYALDEGIFEIKNLEFIEGDSAAADSYIAQVEFDVIFLKSMSNVLADAKKHPARSVEGFHRNEELFNLMATFGKPKINTTIHVKAQLTMYENDDKWTSTLISIFPQ